MIQPQFPNFKPYDKVAVRMPMDKYRVAWGEPLGAGDLLYVIQQNWLMTLVEEARTGVRLTIKTLDLEPWTR
jgi:hypothetical protein